MSSSDQLSTRYVNLDWVNNPVVDIIFQFNFGSIVLMISLENIIRGGNKILINTNMISDGITITEEMKKKIGNSEENINRNDLYFTYDRSGSRSDFKFKDQSSLYSKSSQDFQNPVDPPFLSLKQKIVESLKILQVPEKSIGGNDFFLKIFRDSISTGRNLSENIITGLSSLNMNIRPIRVVRRKPKSTGNEKLIRFFRENNKSGWLYPLDMGTSDFFIKNSSIPTAMSDDLWNYIKEKTGSCLVKDGKICWNIFSCQERYTGDEMEKELEIQRISDSSQCQGKIFAVASNVTVEGKRISEVNYASFTDGTKGGFFGGRDLSCRPENFITGDEIVGTLKDGYYQEYDSIDYEKQENERRIDWEKEMESDKKRLKLFRLLETEMSKRTIESIRDKFGYPKGNLRIIVYRKNISYPQFFSGEREIILDKKAAINSLINTLSFTRSNFERQVNIESSMKDYYYGFFQSFQRKLYLELYYFIDNNFRTNRRLTISNIRTRKEIEKILEKLQTRQVLKKEEVISIFNSLFGTSDVFQSVEIFFSNSNIRYGDTSRDYPYLKAIDIFVNCDKEGVDTCDKLEKVTDNDSDEIYSFLNLKNRTIFRERKNVRDYLMVLVTTKNDGGVYLSSE